jgi:hypothetical protein
VAAKKEAGMMNFLNEEAKLIESAAEVRLAMLAYTSTRLK